MFFDSLLTKSNFLLYAAKNYNNPQCLGTAEFNNDMKRFMYINRILKKYSRNGNVNYRLLLNHFIVLNNVFSVHCLNRMLYFYCDTTLHNSIYTILSFLNIISNNVLEVKENLLELDDKLVKLLAETTKG